jgi:hypothetical protein
MAIGLEYLLWSVVWKIDRAWYNQGGILVNTDKAVKMVMMSHEIGRSRSEAV